MEDKDFEKIMSSIGVDVDMNDKEIIELNDVIEADIVYETKKREWLKYLWIVPAAAVLFAIFIGVIFMTQVKIAPVNVIGADYNIGEYSIVPDTYSAKTKDIIVGGNVVIGDKSKAFFGPFMRKYEVAEVKQVNDLLISVAQPGTKDLKSVPIFDIIYVVDGKIGDVEAAKIKASGADKPAETDAKEDVKAKEAKEEKSKAKDKDSKDDLSEKSEK